jgi:GntR family transcriptional regulator/MocR family aminotransferase
MKKALKAYHQRRDHLCGLLRARLPHAVEFRVPDGGMALWARFDPSLPLAVLSEKAARKGLYLSSGSIYDPTGKGPNATRMGFAAMNPEELERATAVLTAVLA